MEFSRPEYWSGKPFPAPGDLPNPGIKLRFPTLQADSLPVEPRGKPQNAGVGSLSLLQWIFQSQGSNRGLLHCRQILCQLSYRGKPIVFIEFATVLLLFHILFCFSRGWDVCFGHDACGCWAPWPGTDPRPPLLGSEDLNTEPPGESPSNYHPSHLVLELQTRWFSFINRATMKVRWIQSWSCGHLL